MKFVICDIEATGLDEYCELIEIALITYEEGRVSDVYETLINPLKKVPEFITHLTSISNRQLTEAPKFYEIAEALRLRLEGGVFVSHKTEFDLGLLKRKFQELGEELKLKNFCTLKESQKEIPGLKSYNLDALCDFFGIKMNGRHRALGDAFATLELFKKLQDLKSPKSTVSYYLPHHQKCLEKLSSRSGLLIFKNRDGETLLLKSSFNLRADASELLALRPKRKDFLAEVYSVSQELTGSALIAEFKKQLTCPAHFHWVILTLERGGQRQFYVRPYKKGIKGLWFFKKHSEARKKLNFLKTRLKSPDFAYREGKKSKEEILRHNQRVDELSKHERFPSRNVLIIGEGRTLGEKSVVVIRGNHVLGLGYTSAHENEIMLKPDQYLQEKFNQHPSLDMAARNHLRILKNLRTKTEKWRSLSDLE